MEKEIARLPSPAAANSTGSTGFTTVGTTEMEDLWVELDLGREEPVDQVVLIPTLLRGADGNIPGYGFPIRFLLAGYDSEGKQVTLMDQTRADFPNPGQFPVAVHCPVGSKLKGLRLTATVPWSRSGPYVLSLSEIMLLRGNLNVAARAEVTSVSSREYPMIRTSRKAVGSGILPTPPGQNLTEFPAGGTAARYVRMTATQLRNRNKDFAMAEVQAYSDGENRALGAKVIAEESLDEPGWSRAALNDGYSSTGNLLELPAWIDGLERARQVIARRDIAVERRAKLHARA